MQIVPVYAALLAFLFVYLSVRVIRLRRSLKIGIGDANNEVMMRAMRVHSNFAEYVPLGLILLFFLESQRGPSAAVHGLCVVFVVGRCLHAYGVSQAKERFIFRVSGMVMTLVTILSCALYILILATITG